MSPVRLPPLPDDATPAQREARIAELRGLRRARRRTIARRSALGGAGLVLAAAAFVYWLLVSFAGRDLLLAQIVARLPADASLTWQRAQGPAAGPMTLYGVRFAWKQTVFTAREVTLDPDLRPLLGRRLRLDALRVSDARLALAPSTEPFELPRWPDVLPQIAPPLALQADDIRIDRFAVLRVVPGAADAPLIDIHRLRGGLDVGRGYLHAEHLGIESDRGIFALHGDYAPAQRFRTDLVATAVIPARAALTPLRLGLVARGDLARMHVALAGNTPGPVRATLSLEGDAPRWRVRAQAQDVDLSRLLGDSARTAPPTLAMQLDANGVAGRGTLRGRWQQGATLVIVDPSNLRLQQQVLEFDPLSLQLLGGRVVVRGRGDFNDRRNAALHYAVSARGLAWGAGVDRVVGDADVGIAGTHAAWAVAGRARVSRGTRRADVLLDGRGHEASLSLRQLQARMPEGTLDARGNIAWRPQWQWQLRAALRGFDPGYFLPGWNGALRGGLATSGHIEPGGAPRANVALRGLAGQLRGRAVSGRGDLQLRDGGYRGGIALGVARGRLDARATLTPAPASQWTVDAAARAFDPSLLLPAWPGAVDAQLQARGRLAQRDEGHDAVVDVAQLGGTLRGRALGGSAHVVVEGVGARARTPAYRGDIDLRVGASHVQARGSIARELDVDAQLTPLNLADLLPDARGALRGTLRLRGRRDAPDIQADLDGRDLAVAGYRAQVISAHGHLPWRAGTVPGALDVQAHGLVAGLPFEHLDLHARGAFEALQLQASAQGASGRVDLAGSAQHRGTLWNARIAQLRLAPPRGPAWQLQAPAQLRWDGRNLAMDNSCLASSGSGALCVRADWPRRGLDLTAHGLPLSLATAYLPARTDASPWTFDGVADLDAHIQPVGTGWRGTLQLASAHGNARLKAREVLRYDALSLHAQFDGARVQATLASGVFGNGRVDATLATGWDGYAPLSGNLSFDTRTLTWLELFSPDIVDPRGHLSGQLALGGTRAQPRLGGQAQLDGFHTDLPALGIALTDGRARLDAQADGSARITGSVRSGEGTLDIRGRLAWQGDSTPLQLHLSGRNVQAADTRELRAVIDPDVDVRVATGQPIAVTGTVTVPSADIQLERLDRGVAASPDVVVLDPANPDAKLDTPFALDLTLVAGKDVHLAGFGLTGAVTGRLQVHALPGHETTARGQLDVSGRYVAYGQRLEITRGQLSWSGTPVGDPRLDIRAERDVGDLTAGVDVRGRASAPQASVWSSDGASQSEALSLLALGRPLSSVSGDQGRQLNAANAALSAGGSLLASQLGARIGLDAAGVGENRALGGSVLGIGKYFSPRLYVGYGVSLLGTGQVLTLKYLLRKGFDIEVESSTVENRASVNYRHEK